MDERLWVWGLCVASVCVGCMNAPHEGSGLDGGSDGGGALDRGVDAGPLKPALGHVPDGASCGDPAVEGSALADGSGGRTADDDAGGLSGSASAAGSGEPSDAGPSVPSPARAGDLRITELLADPKTLDDAAGEWFELYNPTDTTFDLYGCGIEDRGATPFVLKEHVLVPPAAYVTVARGTAPGFAPTLTASFSLTNSAGQIGLTCAGVSIDRVVFDKAMGFPLKAGESAQLDAAQVAALGADPSVGVFCLSTTSYGPELGTPGAANLPCVVADAAAP